MAFLVQARREGHWNAWPTDSRHATLDAALAAAQQLHEQFNRRVRVVDENEVVHLRLPGRKTTATSVAGEQ